MIKVPPATMPIIASGFISTLLIAPPAAVSPDPSRPAALTPVSAVRPTMPRGVIGRRRRAARAAAAPPLSTALPDRYGIWRTWLHPRLQ